MLSGGVFNLHFRNTRNYIKVHETGTIININLVLDTLKGLGKAVFVCNGTLKIDPIMKV